VYVSLKAGLLRAGALAMSPIQTVAGIPKIPTRTLMMAEIDSTYEHLRKSDLSLRYQGLGGMYGTVWSGSFSESCDLMN
jgi:hypothetical protein